jgi:uncharacterized protein YecE (DUF72 family)
MRNAGDGAAGLRQVRIGCSGWNYKHWRERVYPKGLPARSWLDHYSTLFDTVEVNATFYRLPRTSAVAHWVEITPRDFLFAVKASRYLTHVKRLRELGQGVERFYEAIAPLVDSPKLGPVLWQLPENFHRDDERLGAALERLPSGRHCFEFRHESWFVPDVYALLREHRAALVIGDHPQRPFQSRELTADWTYVRFHTGRGRDGNYGPRQLEDWAGQLRKWRREIDVYAYFNNDWQGFAVANATKLAELVRSAARPVGRVRETARTAGSRR